MDYRSVLKTTLITEKATNINEKENKYTFEVGMSATKGQIKEAIENLYDVSVINVNVLKKGGKIKRSWVGSRKKYTKPAKKKAIVQLKDGDKLNVYEGGTE